MVPGKMLMQRPAILTAQRALTSLFGMQQLHRWLGRSSSRGCTTYGQQVPNSTTVKGKWGVSKVESGEKNRRQPQQQLVLLLTALV